MESTQVCRVVESYVKRLGGKQGALCFEENLNQLVFSFLLQMGHCRENISNTTYREAQPTTKVDPRLKTIHLYKVEFY